MNISKTLTTLAAIGILLTNPFAVFAQTASPSAAPKTGANQTAKIAALHTACDNAISMRLTSLNSAATRMNGLVKLSANQKSQFSGEITTDINGLTALKSKCDADTDLPTLRSDYQSVFTTFRIYAEFLPQLHLLIASDTMGTTTDKLTDLSTKLQDRIQKAGNPSNLTILLSDMQTKVADAEKQYGTVQSQVGPLTPQMYDSNPTGTSATLKNARSEIQTGAGDLKGAFSDAKTLIQDLKAMPTASASPAK